MLFVYEGIAGHRINLKDGEEHCKLCCFNDCEVDCMDHVPCRMGCYYKEIETPAIVKKMLRSSPLRMTIIHRHTIGDWVGYRNNKEVCRASTMKEARVMMMNIIREESKKIIKKTKYKKNIKGKYQITFRGIYVSSSASMVEARRRACERIDEYFDYLIKLEGLK